MKNAIKVLAFVLVVIIIGAGVVWFYVNPEGNEFTYSDGAKNGTLEINGYSGKETKVVIPEKIKGKEVVSVAENLFANSDITSVEIPDTVTEIEQKAFYQCKKLESVKLGKNVKSIGESAFINCESLKSINLPATLEKINGAAFYGCKNITFEIEENADFVVKDGILYNKAMTTVYWIPTDKDLTSFVFPSTVKTFLPYAVAGHDELVKFTVPDGVTSIPDSMFMSCPNLETVVFPDSVTKIGTAVFFGDTKLREITLSKSVTSIGKNCFPVKDIEETKDFVLKVYENSSAYSYAVANEINYEIIK